MCESGMTIADIKPYLELMKEWPAGGNAVEKLPGDASDRRFYRLEKKGCGTAILMVLAEPHRGGELPFIDIRNHLAASGVRVPELYAYDRERGMLLLEDAGERTLQEELSGRDEETKRRFYRLAVEELVKIHYDAGPSRSAHCGAFDIRFDRKKFLWELDFFIEHTLEGHLARGIDPADKEAMRRIFAGICGCIASLPMVLTHRDYHSRNLLVKEGRLVVVDFQDARLGPCQYDLASLLRDSYLVLSDDVREEMVEYYISLKEEKEKKPVDVRRFQAALDLVSVQRCLKAAGTFGYMNVVKGNDSYLQYLNPAFANVRAIIAENARLAALGKILFKYIE